MAENTELKFIATAEDQASDKLDNLGGKITSLGSIAAGVAVGGLVALGAGVAAAGASSIAAAGDFESGMNRFASVTGSAIEDAGFSLDDFKGKFLQLGAETQFSAAQAQEAAIALAKGGVAIPDIMAGATQATLDLAAAGELELAPAADIVAKQLGVWGETGVQAGEVANLLAQAANASTVDVDELALGLSQVGGTAKVAGVEFNDLVQTMAMISPNFASAADAGTSLKTMLASLQPKSNDAAEAMMDLELITVDVAKASKVLGQDFAAMGDPMAGVEEAISQQAHAMTKAKAGTEAYTKEYNKHVQSVRDSVSSNVFFDAAGSFVGMEQAATLLKDATKDLSEEQRLQAFNTIFGSDAIRAAAAVANAGGEGFRAMGEAMGNAGTAADQAAQRNQGFKFALDSLMGTVETVQIVIGSALIPILTSLINDVVIPAANGVLNLAQAWLDAGARSTEFWEALNSISPTLAAVYDGILLLAENLSTILTAALGAAGGAVLIFWGTITGSLIPAFIAWAGAAVASATATIVALTPILVPIAAIAAAVALLKIGWDNDWLGIRTTLSQFWTTTGQPIFTQLQTWLASTLTSALSTLAGFWTGTLQPALQLVWSFISVSVIPLLVALGTTVFGALGAALSTLAGFWTGVLWPALQTVWGFVSTSIVPIFAALADIHIAALGLAVRSLAAYWDSTLQPALQTVWNFISANVIPVIQLLAETHIAGLKIGLSTLASVWTGTLQPALSSFAGFLSGTIGPALSAIASVISSIVGALRSMADAIRNMPSLPSMPDVPGFASGVRNFSGGLAIVGEEGPELVSLPQGSNVYTAGETRSMLSGGGSNTGGTQPIVIKQTFNINGDVSDSQARRFMQLAREEMQKVAKNASVNQKMGRTF